MFSVLQQEYLMEDQLFLEDNTEMVQMREREINTILRSITELNSIFKDIASMVAEQVRIGALIGIV